MKGSDVIWYVLGTLLVMKAAQADRSRRTGMNFLSKRVADFVQGDRGFDNPVMSRASMRNMEKTARSIAELNTRVCSKVGLSHLLLEVKARQN